MTDVEERMAALEHAAASATGHVDSDLLADVATVGKRLRERLALSRDHTVVALAGPSGTGRSSLLNALADLDFAWVGTRRPTTDEPLACVWGMYEARPLVDWLGVSPRYQFSRESALDAKAEADMQGLVLLDLPALDMVGAEQRGTTAFLLDRVDVLVWVLDPTKYADQVVHEEYLRRFAVHKGVCVIAFNRIDELSGEEVRVCLEDLAELLRRNGFAGVPVVPTSVVTGAGIAELRGLLGAYVSSGRAADDRLTADVVGCAGKLAEAIGGPGRPTDQLVSGHAISGQAKEALVSELAAIARVGHGHSPAARSHVDRAVRRLVSAATDDVPASWALRIAGSMGARSGELADGLAAAVDGGESVGSEQGQGSGWRRMVLTLQWVLFLLAFAAVLWLCVPFIPSSWSWAEPLTTLTSPRFALPDRLFGLSGLDRVPAIPVAALVVVGGLLSGIGMAIFGRTLRRRSAEPPEDADRRVRERLAEQAERVLFGPLEAEIAAYRSCVRALQQAARR